MGADVPFVADSLTRLCAACQPDGSWISEDGDAYHVEVTLQALRALLATPERPGEPSAPAPGWRRRTLPRGRSDE